MCCELKRKQNQNTTVAPSRQTDRITVMLRPRYLCVSTSSQRIAPRHELSRQQTSLRTPHPTNWRAELIVPGIGAILLGREGDGETDDSRFELAEILSSGATERRGEEVLCHATAQRRGHLKRQRAASAPTLQPLHHAGDVPGRASVLPGKCHSVPDGNSGSGSGSGSGSDQRSAGECDCKEGHLLGRKGRRAPFCPLKLSL